MLAGGRANPGSERHSRRMPIATVQAGAIFFKDVIIPEPYSFSHPPPCCSSRKNSSQMRIEEEAVGSIPLRLNGQYGSRVNQVCTLLNCIHTLSNSVHYWIVFYTFLLCSLLNWVHCWTVHTFEIGPLLNCAHCWTRNSDPVSLSSALNPSHTIMHERCMWDRSALASWEWICTLGAGANSLPLFPDPCPGSVNSPRFNWETRIRINEKEKTMPSSIFTAREQSSYCISSLQIVLLFSNQAWYKKLGSN